MAIYKGFSTKSFKFSSATSVVGTLDNDFGPYTLTDKNLVVMDLLNQFSTRKGEKLMNPNFGCIIWDRLFDPLTEELKSAIIKDVTAIIKSDPRVSMIDLITLQESPDGAGLLFDASIVIKNSNELVSLNLLFDNTTGAVNSTVSY